MYTKTGNERKTADELLSEARAEANELRCRVEYYKKIVLSSRLLMGHELKRPATAVGGYLDLVAEDLERDGNLDTLTLVEKAREECSRLGDLSALFTELLRFDTEDAWVGTATTVLDNVIDEILDELPEKHDARNRVAVEIGSNVPVIPMSGRAIRLILVNLIENALLYSQCEAPIRVSARIEGSAEWADEEALLIEVTDEGVGIPADYTDKVFDPFVRLRADVASGSGLGLTLVKSLVELNGGEVLIESQPNKRTNVRVTIPIDHGPERETTR